MIDGIRFGVLYDLNIATNIYDTVAEWLRRSTRNRLELFRVGSSPASVGNNEMFHCYLFFLRTLLVWLL